MNLFKFLQFSKVLTIDKIMQLSFDNISTETKLFTFLNIFSMLKSSYNMNSILVNPNFLLFNVLLYFINEPFKYMSNSEFFSKSSPNI